MNGLTKCIKCGRNIVEGSTECKFCGAEQFSPPILKSDESENSDDLSFENLNISDDSYNFDFIPSEDEENVQSDILKKDIIDYTIGVKRICARVVVTIAVLFLIIGIVLTSIKKNSFGDIPPDNIHTESTNSKPTTLSDSKSEKTTTAATHATTSSITTVPDTSVNMLTFSTTIKSKTNTTTNSSTQKTTAATPKTTISTDPPQPVEPSETQPPETLPPETQPPETQSLETQPTEEPVTNNLWEVYKNEVINIINYYYNNEDELSQWYFFDNNDIIAIIGLDSLNEDNVFIFKNLTNGTQYVDYAYFPRDFTVNPIDKTLGYYTVINMDDIYVLVDFFSYGDDFTSLYSIDENNETLKPILDVAQYLDDGSVYVNGIPSNVDEANNEINKYVDSNNVNIYEEPSMDYDEIINIISNY